MNTISGTITNAQPVDSQDDFGTKYQDVVITGADGVATTGRIGSKQGYQQGIPINVTVEQRQGQEGEYNYFKRFNPQYGGSQPPQKPSQAAPAAQESTNGQREMRIVRGNALNAVMSATEVSSDMIGEYLLTSVQFILTGDWILKPKSHSTDNSLSTATDGRPIDDDIPF